MKQSISVIIPIINEERTIVSIAECVLTWGKAKELIIVDDEASMDDSGAALKQFGKRVTYLRNAKGVGKSEAMYIGIKKSKGTILMILDGDMTNLSHKDLDAMTHPVSSSKAAMVIGVPKFWRAGTFEPWNDVSGTRVFRRDLMEAHIESMRTTAYGVEVFLNRIFKPHGILRVRLPHVFVFNKWAKMSVPEALEGYLREGRELLQQVLISPTVALAPKAKRAIEVALSYIRKALDYLTQT